MNNLSIDNILDGNNLELFSDEQDSKDEIGLKEAEKKDIKESEQIITDVDVDNLFTKQESVGSDGKNQDGDTPVNKNSAESSPNPYSSIAQSLKDAGVFSDIDDDFLKKIESPEAFVKAIENQVATKLDETQKRINEALELGVKPDKVKEYENTLGYLNSITSESLDEDTEEASEIRQKLIYNDYINRGFSKERAMKELDKSLKAGSDIEDAKESLESNKSYYSDEYNGLLDSFKSKEAEERKIRESEAENLKKSILDSETIVDGLKLDKKVRNEIYNNISKPIFKDKNGKYLTALQKYEKENHEDFIRKVGLFFTLTNGFKDINALVKSKVKEESKKTYENLEKVINNTSRDVSGNLTFLNKRDDKDSYSGYRLDIS